MENRKRQNKQWRRCFEKKKNISIRMGRVPIGNRVRVWKKTGQFNSFDYYVRLKYCSGVGSVCLFFLSIFFVCFCVCVIWFVLFCAPRQSYGRETKQFAVGQLFDISTVLVYPFWWDGSLTSSHTTSTNLPIPLRALRWSIRHGRFFKNVVPVHT